jgi:hypothetical protein
MSDTVYVRPFFWPRAFALLRPTFVWQEGENILHHARRRPAPQPASRRGGRAPCRPFPQFRTLDLALLNHRQYCTWIPKIPARCAQKRKCSPLWKGHSPSPLSLRAPNRVLFQFHRQVLAFLAAYPTDPRRLTAGFRSPFDDFRSPLCNFWSPFCNFWSPFCRHFQSPRTLQSPITTARKPSTHRKVNLQNPPKCAFLQLPEKWPLLHI